MMMKNRMLGLSLVRQWHVFVVEIVLCVCVGGGVPRWVIAFNSRVSRVVEWERSSLWISYTIYCVLLLIYC